MTQQIMIIVGAPADSVEAVLDAIAGAGAGVIGEYTHCSFVNPGEGSFKPSAAANPALGEKDTINRVPEMRIETFCDRAQAKAVVQAIRDAHPYEEPVIYLVPLLAEDDLI
jgi:hypothetical protein